MVRKASQIILTALIALGLFVPGFANKAEAKGKKKVGFFTKLVRHVKRDVKRNVKKAGRAVVKTGAAIQNKVMDGAVKAKSAVTGKKPKKVWVKGHYKKGNKHLTKGHFARVRRHKHSGGSAPSNPAPTPSNPPSAPAGSPLPPVDPALPN